MVIFCIMLKWGYFYKSLYFHSKISYLVLYIIFCTFSIIYFPFFVLKYIFITPNNV
ncbi:hypothetical protein [Plasmodium yoelii yoelii]|uniref:Uncharacterized protein n=1 Tax=Plasmodium yoelii yoelii TaxID=73239 RepID=Q7R854_PLAYO|nr:hypothetical protein [Plasmodium yoelii yoelii]